MNVFELVAKLSLDDSQYTKKLGVAQKGFTKLGNGLKKTLTTSAKIGTAAVVAATAAVVTLTKTAVSQYGQYEQLVGGVETLFGKSAAAVQQYADQAYKTAGMSANQYMETATSFSASLLQGLKGDTAAAAQYADRAIVDMSDNANKMGTAIESIQFAYQGFAKQNYTINLMSAA